MSNHSEWDVVIVGGGSAGLGAALTLTRARRRVLVVDGHAPRNRFSGQLHALLGHDGTPPLELLAKGRREVTQYGGLFRDGQVTALHPGPQGIAVELADGTGMRARRVIVATGLRDVLPEVDGLAERWGSGVAVCPYCDGWEVRDQRIGILATSPGSAFQAQLLRQWSADIVYLENGAGIPDAATAAAFASRGIVTQVGVVASVLSNETAITGVQLAGGQTISVDAIFTAPRTEPLDSLLVSLGAERADTPQGSFVQVDRFGRTSVSGVWAVGNVIDPNASLAVAIGDAARAAGMINHELVIDDVATAVDEDRAQWVRRPRRSGSSTIESSTQPGARKPIRSWCACSAYLISHRGACWIWVAVTAVTRWSSPAEGGMSRPSMCQKRPSPGSVSVQQVPG